MWHTHWCANYLDRELSGDMISTRYVMIKCAIVFHCCRCSLIIQTQIQWSWDDESKFQIVFENHRRCVFLAKDKKDHQDCYQFEVQKLASVIVWGCISAHGMVNLHICEGTLNAERYIQVLEQHILPSKQRLFQGHPCLFQQDNAKSHSAHVTTAWLCSKRVWVLDWPACSPDLSPTENERCIMKCKIRQWRPQNVEQLKLYIPARMGKNFTYNTSTINVLSSQMLFGCC